MKRLLLSILTACLLLAGCSLFGSDDCDEREGLFIQTDRQSYQVGEEATVTVENCTGEALSIDRDYDSPPDFKLEKKVANEWELADHRGTSLYDIESDEIGAAESYKFALPIEPLEILIDSVPGTYRYRLDLYDGYERLGVKDYLSEERRRSNTFDVTE